MSNGSPPATAASATVHNSSDTSSQEKIPKQCILCGSKDKQMSRYINWGSTERKFLSTYLDLTPSDNSFICKSHLMEAKRHHNNPDFIPKWKLGPRNISHPLKNVLILSALNQYTKNLLNLYLHLPLSLRRSLG